MLMSNPLNTLAIDKLLPDLSHAYQLGDVLSHLKPIAGGLLHQCWQFRTTEGDFVLKKLNPTVIHKSGCADRYRVSEEIANQLGKHISAVSALRHDGDPLFFLANEVVMVFPYVAGHVLSQQQVMLYHIARMGEMLAKIHQATIQAQHAPAVEWLELDSLSATVDDYAQCLAMVKNRYPDRHDMETALRNNLVISHRDCDPKNVLWDQQGRYWVIDWESAGWINKTKDTLVTAIYWSLDSDYQINQDYFSHFIKAYRQSGGEFDNNELAAAFYGLISDWLTWLDFNISRMASHSSESIEGKLGRAEVGKTLKAIPILLSQADSIAL